MPRLHLPSAIHPAVALVTLLLACDPTGPVTPPSNDAPTADAGGPYEGIVGEATSLDGTGSTDPDGEVASYAWVVEDGEPTELSGTSPAYTCSVAGTFDVRLTVTDDDGAEGSGDTSIECVDPNLPPVAEAGGPYTVGVGDEVTLVGSDSSDPDGSIAAWDWTIDDGGPTELSGEAVEYVCAAAGTLDVTLLITDDAGATDEDTTVLECVANLPPSADAGGPYVARVDETVELDASGSADPDGSIDSWAWLVADGLPTELSGQIVSYTCHAGGEFEVTLTVTDDDGEAATGTTIVECMPNVAPSPDAGGPYAAGVGDDVTLDGSASEDPDGTIAAWSWTIADGASTELEGETVAYACPTGGTFDVTLTVTDNEGATGTTETTVECVVPNEAPTADAGGPYEGLVGASVPFDGSGSTDTDGAITDWAWTVDDGGPAALSGQTVAYTCAAAGTFAVTLTVTDDHGATAEASTDVECIEPNVEPTIAFTEQSYQGTVPETVTVEVEVTDPDAGPEGVTIGFDFNGDGEFDITVLDAEPPFSAQTDFSCDAPGTFPLLARALDGEGAASTANSEVVCAEPPPNVRVTITDEAGGTLPNEVEEFTSLTYVVRVENPSDTRIDDVELSVEVDADATNVTASDLAPSGGVWTGQRASMQPGEEWAITFALTLEAYALSPHTTTATVSGTGDSDPEDNAATVSLTVVEAPEPVCDPNSGFNIGSIRTAEDLAALRRSGATRYGGSLFLDDTSITEIDLPCLVEVGAFVNVENNADLIRVHLPALETFDRSFVLQNNPLLEVISAPLLQTTTFSTGIVAVQSNPLLTQLDLSSLRSLHSLGVDGESINDLKLGALESLGSMSIGPLPSLSSLILSSLRELTGSNSHFRGVERLETLVFPVLESVSLFNIRSGSPSEIHFPELLVADRIILGQTTGLREVSAPKLDSVRLELSASSNAAIESIDVPLLRTVGGVLVEGNPELRSFDLSSLENLRATLEFTENGTAPGVPLYDFELPAFVVSEHILEFNRNGALRSIQLPALADLPTSQARITAVGNPDLATVSAPSLGRVEGSGLRFLDNPTLTTLDFPSLHSTGYLVMQGNEALEVAAFPTLERVPNSLVISESPALSAMSFPGLTEVGGLQFRRNPLITSLTALSGITSGAATFTVQENASLASLDGLRNVGDALGADPIFHTFRISSNPLICLDDAQAFFDHLEGKYPGDMVQGGLTQISGPTCPDDPPPFD